MKKSFTTTLVLLGTLVALLGWYLVYEKKLRPEHEAAEEKSKELVSLDRGTIAEIAIERAKNLVQGAKTPPQSQEYEKFALKKTGVEWTLTAPLEYPADGATVDTILTTATGTKYDRVVDEAPKDLEAYGLKTPVVKAVFRKDAKTPPQEIWVGNDTPTGSSSYVKLAGSDKVYRAPRVVRTSFERTLKDLRSKEILKVGRPMVSEVELSTGKEDIVLKKGEKDAWLLARDGLPADATEWNKTLNALVDAKAKDFASDQASDAGKYGLKPPAAKVTVTQSTPDKKKVTLSLGKVGDKFYAKRDDQPTIFVVDKDVLTKVQQPSSAYIDRHLAQFNRFDAHRIVLTRAGELLELSKGDKDGEWKIAGDDKTKIDKAKLDTLLTSLQDMKIAKFRKGQPGVKDAALSVQVWEKNDKPESPKVSLKFGKAQGKEVPGESTGVTIPFSITDTDFKKLNVGKADLAPAETKAPKAPENKSDNKSAAKTPDKGKG